METMLIILSASKYSITDEATKTTTEGVTCWVYPSGNMRSYEPNDNNRGRKPFKSTLPVEMYNQITCCPGIYNCEVEMKTNSNMKAEMSILSAEFMGEVK